MSENGAGNVRHYLLLTIFIRLSIAEISTWCDDINWHAVKPSDMRLQSSTPASASVVSSFLVLPSSYIVNVRCFICTSCTPVCSQIARAIDFDQSCVPDGIALPHEVALKHLLKPLKSALYGCVLLHRQPRILQQGYCSINSKHVSINQRSVKKWIKLNIQFNDTIRSNVQIAPWIIRLRKIAPNK